MSLTETLEKIGEERGEARGLAKGKVQNVLDMVRDGDISVDLARAQLKRLALSGEAAHDIVDEAMKKLDASIGKTTP